MLEEGSLECVGLMTGPAESRKGFLIIRRGAIEVHLPKGAVRKFDLSPSQEASKSLLTAPSSEGALGAGIRGPRAIREVGGGCGWESRGLGPTRTPVPTGGTGSRRLGPSRTPVPTGRKGSRRCFVREDVPQLACTGLPSVLCKLRKLNAPCNFWLEALLGKGAEDSAGAD